MKKFLLITLSTLLVGSNVSTVSAQTEETARNPYGNRELPINAGEYYTPPPIFVDSLTLTPSGEREFVGELAIYNGGEEIVGDVRYRLELLSPAPITTTENEIVNDAPYVFDIQPTSQAVSLLPKATKKLAISYTLPDVPGGEYRLRAQIVTSRGKELGWGDATLTAPANDLPFALLTSGTISLPEFPGVLLPPLSGPNISPGDSFSLLATVKNTSAAVQTYTPIIEMYRFNDSEKPLSTTSAESITVATGEESNIEIPVIAPATAGVYRAHMYLSQRDEARLSPIAQYHWVVRGAGADIFSARIVELATRAGEKVLVAVDYAGPADAETRLQGTMTVEVIDEAGLAGMFTVPEQLELTDLVEQGFAEVTLNRDLQGKPGLRVTIKDLAGTLLATYTVDLPLTNEELQQAPTQARASAGDNTLLPSKKILVIAGLVGIILIFTAVAAFLMRRRRPIVIPPVASLLLVTIAGGALWILHPMITEAQINVAVGVLNKDSKSCKVAAGWCKIPGRTIELFINQPQHNRTDFLYDRNSTPLSFKVLWGACSNDLGRIEILSRYDRHGGLHATLDGVGASWASFPTIKLFRAGSCSGHFCQASAIYGGNLNFSGVPQTKTSTTLQLQAFLATHAGVGTNLLKGLDLGYVHIVNTWVHFKSTKQCSDTLDNDGDALIDSADPGCHTDGNPNNPATYDPNDDDERNLLPTLTPTPSIAPSITPTPSEPIAPTSTPSATPAPLITPTPTPTLPPTATPTPTPLPVPECRDGADNDGDGKIDCQDNGCWVNPTDQNTCNPDDNSEYLTPPIGPGPFQEED